MKYAELETRAVSKSRPVAQPAERGMDVPDTAGKADSLAHVIFHGTSSAGAHASRLQRAIAAQPTSANRSVLELQRQYGNQYVQRVLALAMKADGEGEVTPEVDDAIQRERGSGQPLDRRVRAQIGPALGADFDGVRVHTDATADMLNRALSARAFTTGQDIFFRQGEYNPGSAAGRELLAHELTHVVQQAGAPVQAKLRVGAPGDRYEQEADRVARAVMRQEHESVSGEVGVGLRRQMSVEEGDDEHIQTKAQETLRNPVIQRQQEITFPPEVITVSARRREALLRRAGWQQTNVQLIVRDFQGLPMSGRRFFVQFVSTTGEVTSESGAMTGGILTLNRIWIKPEGAMRIMGVSVGAPSMVLEGNAAYRRASGTMAFEVTQNAQQGTITASSRTEASEKLAAEGSVGVTLGPVELGGTVTGETGRTQERGTEQQWQVLRARPSLTISQTR